MIASNGIFKLSCLSLVTESMLILTISDLKHTFYCIIGIICGPVLLIWTLIRGDLKMIINFPYLLSPGFIVCSAWAFLLWLNSTFHPWLLAKRKYVSLLGKLTDFGSLSGFWSEYYKSTNKIPPFLFYPLAPWAIFHYILMERGFYANVIKHIGKNANRSTLMTVLLTCCWKFAYVSM